MDPLVLYVIALLLLVYNAMCAKKNGIALAAVLLAIVAGVILALYESADLLLMLLGILIFNGMISTYHSKQNYAFFLLAVFFILPLYQFPALVSQVMLLGFLSGAYFFMRHVKRASVSVERRRDAAQLILGLAFIAAFVLVSAMHIRVLLIATIMIASLAGNFSMNNKKSAISRALHSFERSGAVLGQGAMWLATGSLLAMSFLNNSGLVAVLVTIFIGDAVATLVGTAYRIPLPYNSKKSVTGTLAYFAVAAAISFPFIGYLGLLTGLVAALVESAPIHIDDNFDTAVVLTVLLIFLGFALTPL